MHREVRNLAHDRAIHVHRVQGKDDPFLKEALEGPYERIPQDQRTEIAQILGMVDIHERERGSAGSEVDAVDIFLIATTGGRERSSVVAFLYATRHPAERVIFISYLAQSDRLSVTLRLKATNELLFALQAHEAECQAYLWEVDTGAKARRFHRWAADFGLIQSTLSHVPFVQPDLSVNCDPSRERQLMLCLAARDSHPWIRNTPEAVAMLLNFVYDKIYGDLHVMQDDGERYLAYVMRLKARVLQDYSAKQLN